MDQKGGFSDGMTLEEIRQYLQVHGFLHVTPRYNVEKVENHNFYDFVVLEVPGNCASGLVWQRKFGGSHKGITFSLQPHQLIQLSLGGALITGLKHEITGDGESESCLSL